MPLPLLLALALATPAAGTGHITGAVHTVDGTPLRGVRVEIAIAGTLEARRTYSDHQGRFLMTELPPASYRVTATAPALALLVSNGVQVKAAATAEVDLAMEVTPVVVKVRLVYKAPSISTRTPNMKEVFDLDFMTCTGLFRSRDVIHYKVEAK